MAKATILEGDCLSVLATLDAGSVQTCITSPPYYGLRDYGHAGQIGLEPTPEAYVASLVAVFREVRRVLKDDGTLWLNLGDSFNAYNGGAGPGSTLSKTQTEHRPQLSTGYGLQVKSLKPKDLIGIPWRVAFALQADGWFLRSDIVWHKPNPMPESVTDRPTKAHEYLFLLAKSQRYFYDADAIKEPAEYAGPNGSQHSPYGQGFTRRTPEQEATRQDKQRATAAASIGSSPRRMAGFNDRWDASEADGTAPLTRNKRSVWSVSVQPYNGAHFATFPPKLIEPCVLAGSRALGSVIEPEYVESPLAERAGDDPSLLTGRAGMNRPRHPDEGTRRITVAEQRDYAAQLRQSHHRAAMEAEAGSAFAHYLRTDASGARPIPAALLDEWIDRGWLVCTAAPAPEVADPSQCTVLDPFNGAGTTGVVALRNDRNYIGIEINPEYARMARDRIYDDGPLLNEVAA